MAYGSIKADKVITSAGEVDLTQANAPATQSEDGLMSAADKTKLDGVEEGAEANTVVPSDLTGKADLTGATFSGNIVAGSINGASTTSAGTRIYSSGEILVQKNAGSTTSVFSVYNGDSSSTPVEIKADGTARFASTATIGGGALNGVEAGIQLFPTGGIHATQASGSSTILSGYVEGSSTKNVAITAQGSAFFENSVHVGGAGVAGDFDTYINAAIGSNYFIASKAPGDLSTSPVLFGVDTNGSATFTTGLKMFRTAGDNSQRINIGESDTLAIWQNDGNFSIGYDGSASFGGDVQVAGTKIRLATSSNSGLVRVLNSSLVDTIGLDGTEGSATFGTGYKVKIRPFDGDGADQLWIEKTNGSKPFVVTGSGGLIANDNIAISRTLGTSACYVGQLNGVDTSYIHASGEASFAGTVSTDNYYTVDRDVTPGTGALYLGFTQGVEKFKVGTDGGASFQGNVSVGSNVNSTGPGGGVFLQKDSSGQAGVYVYSSTASSTIPVFQGRAGTGDGTAKVMTSEINSDGSATFQGSVRAGNGTYTGAGTAISASGNIYIQGTPADVTNSGVALSVVNPTDYNAPKVTISHDGSAIFQGNIFIGDENPWNAADRTGNYLASNGSIEIYRDVNGSANGAIAAYYKNPNGMNDKVFSVGMDGSAIFEGTVTATVVPPSDARFKENITPATPQLADVTALGGILRNYDWNEEAPVNDELRAVRQLGLIAQEAAEVCPGIVKDIHRTKRGDELTPAVTDEEGNVTEEPTYEEVDDSYKGISTEALMMKMLGAISELKAENDALRADVEALKAQ